MFRVVFPRGLSALPGHEHYCPRHDHRLLCRDVPCLLHEVVECDEPTCRCGRIMTRVPLSNQVPQTGVECPMRWREPGHDAVAMRLSDGVLSAAKVSTEGGDES
jgi:hypothetical protein